MRIKVTAGELTVMSKALTDLTSAKMPASVGYHVARLSLVLGTEVQTVLRKQADVMEKYKAETGNSGELRMTAKNPNFEKARTEMNDLLAQEVAVAADIVTIPKNVILEPGTLLILSKFIKVAGS